MVLSVFKEVEGVKSLTIAIPVNKYKRLQEITKVCGLSVSKLSKEGIDLVLKEYEKKLKNDGKESKEHQTAQT